MRPDQFKIRHQLDRLLASPEFVRTDRMARFLRFVVEHTMDGNTEILRERQIGIEVFDRPSDWDPKLDNVVRSEARRLRSKLDAYAATRSPDETIRITIPKGSYVADFATLDHDPAPQRPEHLDPITYSLPLVIPQSAGRSRAILVGLGLIVLGTLLGVGLWLRASQPVRADNFEIVPFSTEIGQQFSPAIAPDGSKIAYVWDEGGTNYNIYIKTVASGQVKRLTDATAPDLHPAWSPDGRDLAFLRSTLAGYEVFLKPAEGGIERHIGTVHSVSFTWASDNAYSGCQNLSWSPDGRTILLTDSLGASHGYGLVLLDVDSGSKTVLTFPPGDDQDCYARFSADGTRIAFVRYISHGVGDVFTMSSRGTDVKQLTFDRRYIRGLDWTSDAKHLVFASNRRGTFEIRTVASDGGESQSLPADTGFASDPTLARTGGWMAYVEGEETWNIWRAPLVDGHLGLPERFLASSGQNHSPSFSPDGSTIGFVSNRSGSPEIWFVDSDRSNLRQMTHFGGPWLGTIRWSPDGKKIIFDARPNGHSAIFTLPAAGGKPTLLEQEDFEVRRPAWSRDGKSIYFDSTRAGRPQIWKRSLETGQTNPIGPVGALGVTESVDSSTLFFRNSGQSELWMSQQDGSQPTSLTNLRPDPDLDWAVVGDGVYFAISDASNAELYYYRMQDRSRHLVGELKQQLSPGTPSLVVSPDGKWLLYAAIDHIKSDIKLRKEMIQLR